MKNRIAEFRHGTDAEPVACPFKGLAAFGFDDDELSRIALQGIESTWLDASDRQQLAREFEAAQPGPGRP